MAKFGVFEVAVENILSATGKSKDSLTGVQTTGLNLAAGLIAGFAAAIISQPADTLLSKINKTKAAPGEGTTSRLISMARTLGPSGLFTGMGARLAMIGTLTAGQCKWDKPAFHSVLTTLQSSSTVTSSGCSTLPAVSRLPRCPSNLSKWIEVSRTRPAKFQSSRST